MRIGIFVITPGRRGGGPETYEIELVRALARNDRDNEYVIYCTHPEAVGAIGVQQENVRYRVLQPRSRFVSIPVTLPAMLVKDGVDFFHATMVPPPIATKPYLLSILCYSNWSHPEFYQTNVVRRLNALLNIGVKKAKYLLCISGHLRDNMHNLKHVPRERLALTYMGVGPEFQPKARDHSAEFMAEKYGIQAPYILFVGQQQERKNIFRVIDAYAGFRKRTGSDARLVLVGRPDEPGAIRDAIERHGLQSMVTRIRYIPHRELPELYSAAEMFVFPSLWEGFGIPILESMACGTVVVTSNVTCLPEVAGDAAVIANPESSEEICEGMVRLAQDSAYRAELTRRGLERAKLFTWDNCAAATREMYARMAD